jgi:uncharacterized membrane protein
MAIAQFFSHRHLQLHLLNLSARQRLLLAVAVGGAAWMLLPGSMQSATRLVAAWDMFCLSGLTLIWGGTRSADATHIRRVATRQDPGRTWAFVAVLVASTASLLAVVALLSGIATMRRSEVTVHVLLSIGAVVGAWLQLHAVFALRYAHQYYSENLATDPPDPWGGLDFPGGTPGNYWDFAYFSFVVGMTAQTADVAITTTPMRQLVMLHGLLAFAFNTSVVALTINLVAGLL